MGTCEYIVLPDIHSTHTLELSISIKPSKVGCFRLTLRSMLRVRLWALLSLAPSTAAAMAKHPLRPEHRLDAMLPYGETMLAYFMFVLINKSADFVLLL